MPLARTPCAPASSTTSRSSARTHLRYRPLVVGSPRCSTEFPSRVAPSRRTLKCVLIYGGASLLIALLLMGPIRARTLHRLDRVAPGSVAFTVANRRRFSDSLSLAAVGT